MPRQLRPTRNYGGTVSLPGDKSIAHRAALVSILARDKIAVTNFPDGDDCRMSLNAAETLGVIIQNNGRELVLTPPESIKVAENTIIECGNSGTTARLLSGIIAGLNISVTLAGDDSLSKRPMTRIIEPLTKMGAEFFASDGHLPFRVVGHKLLPFEYDLPVPSAQVKSAVLLAGVASGCSVTVRENIITRDHTERMLEALGAGISMREIKPVMVTDPVDPRKKKMQMPEAFKKEVILRPQVSVSGGLINIPGDISTAAFFMIGAAISGKTITVTDVGLNPTRTGILDYLRSVGCSVTISNRRTESSEPRGDVTVTGGPIKSRKISGETTSGLIDEIPAIAVLAAFADGTTVIRDASELRFKESNRLEAIAENLKLTGVKCGVLEDGLAIEGGKELTGADFQTFNDHRVAMAFSIASLFLTGPSTIDDASVVNVSCPGFYDILDRITK